MINNNSYQHKNYQKETSMSQLVLTASNWLNLSLITESIRELKSRFRQYRVYKQTYKELSSLTDRELNDIGINRGMIKSVAMEAYLDAR